MKCILLCDFLLILFENGQIFLHLHTLITYFGGYYVFNSEVISFSHLFYVNFAVTDSDNEKWLPFFEKLKETKAYGP